ncbi:hypothetical protein ACU6ZY_20205 [Klebsiella aerogenes]
MLENYFAQAAKDQAEAIKLNQRLLAVQAALEIAKAAVGATGAGVQSKVTPDLKAVSSGINELADAIQAALDKK